jgi:hypothetical protein
MATSGSVGYRSGLAFPSQVVGLNIQTRLYPFLMHCSMCCLAVLHTVGEAGLW